MVFGLGGFLLAILAADKPPTKRLTIILIICFAAFVTTASVMVWHNHQHSKRVEATTEKMLVILARERTIDQLYEDLFPDDFGTVSEALGRLIETNKVGHRVVDVKDAAGLSYRVGLYFAKQ